jgi:hypothetical protein
MDKDELLDCMREAAEAIAEFRHHLPQHSPAAQAQVDEAGRHLDQAMTLLRQLPDGEGPPTGLRLAR